MKRMSKPSRLLVIDYSGNPTHLGHLRCGKWMAHQGKFDHVFYAISGKPATRSDSLDGELRYELAVAATAGDSELSASRVNLYQPGMSWALTAIDGLQKQFPEASISFGISGEYLDPKHRFWLKNWIGAAELFERAVATVFPRGDQTVAQVRDWARLIPEARIEVFYAPSSPISGHQIRELVGSGKSIRYLIPDVVADRIRSSGAYLLPQTRLQQFNPRSAVRSVGLFLSEFDPITIADLRRAEELRESLRLDRIEFMPISRVDRAGTQLSSGYATDSIRYDMVVAATATNPYFRARYAVEQRPDASLSDLLGTLPYATGRIKPTLIFNADWLNPAHPMYLNRWGHIESLSKQWKVVAFTLPSVSCSQAIEWVELLSEDGAAIKIFHTDVDSVEGKDVRGFAQQGLPLAYSVPSPVENIIFKNGLYRPEEETNVFRTRYTASRSHRSRTDRRRASHSSSKRTA